MLYNELEQRYGAHIAKRVQIGLNRSEFTSASLERLLPILEARAEKAAQDYKKLMDNPLERGNVRSEVLQKWWHDAEDLLYLLTVAEDVSTTVRTTLANGSH